MVANRLTMTRPRGPSGPSNTWHILGWPYSLSSFEFNGILHVTYVTD